MHSTRPKWLIVVAVIVGLAIAACTSTDPGAATHSEPPSPKLPAAVAPTPALCDAAEPARRNPFPFNRDYGRRDAQLQAAEHGPAADGAMEYVGGTADFYSIDVGAVAELITDGYLDPYDYQNDSPTAWESFRFMCQHPTVRASGYVVSIDRDDYRTTLDDVDAEHSTPGLLTAALAFCTDAETEMESSLECFWD